ncbi:MAG: O-antigen ligase family protein [Planctomyces sp.]|jgi:O-antigen ligase
MLRESHSPKSKRSPEKRATTANFTAAGYRGLSRISRGMLLTDALIVVLIVILPFVMGGREAWGHRILITSALSLGFVWCLYQVVAGGRLTLTLLEPLMIAGIILVWYQTKPLPPEMLTRISTEYERLLPEWNRTQSGSPTDSNTASGVSAIPLESGTSTDSDNLPSWNTVSLTPGETRHGFLMIVSYVIIGVVLTQRIQSATDARRMLKLISISGLLMAVFAMCQLALSNDLFFWFYRHPSTGTKEILKGAFTNRNHFAQFLVLSIGPLVWWLMEERRRYRDATSDSGIRKGLGAAHGNHSNFGRMIDLRLILLICGTAGVLLSVVLTLSRGGMLAAGAACAVTLVGFWKLSEIRSSLAAVIITAGAAIVGGAFLAGENGVERRIDQLASGDAEQLDSMKSRRTIWKADAEAIRAFPILGTGVGSHRDIYPIYMEDLADFSSFEFSHAESTYINLALETGIVGIGLLALGLLFITVRFLAGLLWSTDMNQSAVLTAVSASLAGGILHAFVDFIWYAPAILVTTIALTATGLRYLSGFGENRGLPIPRVGWLAAALACASAVFQIQPELQQRIVAERYWHQFLISSFDVKASLAEPELDSESEDSADTLAALDLPEDSEGVEAPDRNGEKQLVDTKADTESGMSENPEVTDTAAEETSEPEQSGRRRESIRSLQDRISFLIRSLRASPEQPRVQLVLASLSLKLFDQLQEQSENPLNLLQIRDTVRSAGFENAADKDLWLQKAFGGHIRLVRIADSMAKRSLLGCPVQGNAYLTLLETSFLGDKSPDYADSLIRQAILVRGHDPRVRYIAGQEAIAQGREDEGIGHWEAVFHANSAFRTSITQILGRTMPASFLLERFRPAGRELHDVLIVYRQLNRPAEDISAILDAAEAAIDEVDEKFTVENRVSLLVRCSAAAESISRSEQAVSFLQKACSLDETAYWPRRALGNLLYEHQKFAAAAEMYRWCYEQEPGDENLDWLIRDSRRRALPQPVPTSRASFSRRVDNR